MLPVEFVDAGRVSYEAKTSQRDVGEIGQYRGLAYTGASVDIHRNGTARRGDSRYGFCDVR